MTRERRNLSAGTRSRSAWIAAAALLPVLFVAGALAKPMRAIGRAQAERERAEGNARACRAERAILQRYEEAGGSERAAEALRALAARLPKDVSALEISGVVRMLADVHRLEIASTTISAEQPTSFAVFDDQVMMREVDLAGRGTLADWIALTEDLERCGYPTSVLQLEVARERTDDPAFEVHLVIGLYSSRPADAAHAAGT